MQRLISPAWIIFIAIVLGLLPLLLGQLVVASLIKLHLRPETAIWLFLAMLAGGFVNLPVKRIARDEPATSHPLSIFGMSGYWPHMLRMRRETIIAVNVGGCLVPAALALYELMELASLGAEILAIAAVACAANILVCYKLATPVPGVGIAIPGLIPGLTAAALALLLAPEQAAPVAYVAGVAGPLLGADLLHLKDKQLRLAGIVSIGGAGTFDGIVLSGVIAIYLVV